MEQKSMQELMWEILDIEWEMFHTVQSVDGPTACQQDRKTFEIMRSSQIMAWNEEVAASYLEDLHRAKAAGRNLMTEKYARMMEYTSPCEFRRISSSLPALEQEALPLIERLSRMSVEWMEDLAAKYPYVGSQGRPIRNSGDTVATPSFETYNRGELSTYSAKTLKALEEHYLRLLADGENPAEVILRHTVTQYGYSSLEKAEAAQKDRVERARAGQV